MDSLFTCAGLNFALIYTNYAIVYGIIISLFLDSKAVSCSLISPSMHAVLVLVKTRSWFYVVYYNFLIASFSFLLVIFSIQLFLLLLLFVAVVAFAIYIIGFLKNCNKTQTFACS